MSEKHTVNRVKVAQTWRRYLLFITNRGLVSKLYKELGKIYKEKLNRKMVNKYK